MRSMYPEVPSLQISDLEALRMFVAVADAGGLSAAQGRIGASLSRISQVLNDFEKRFDVKLCLRGRSGFALTEAGEHVYASAAALLRMLEAFEADLAAYRGTLAGQLCIAAHEGDASHPAFLLPQAINRFLSRDRNETRLRLLSGPEDVILNGVVGGSIDIAFGYFPSARSGVTRYVLHEETVNLYCGVGHPLFGAAPGEDNLPAILSHEFAVRSMAPGPQIPPPLRGVKARALAVSQDSRALLVLSGKFLALLPEHFARRWVEGGQMRRLGGDDLSYRIRAELITRDTKIPPAAVAAFLEDYAAACVQNMLDAPRLKDGG